MQQKKSKKGKEVNEKSSEDEGVKGGALVGLSQPYLGCGWFSAKNKKRESIRCAVRSDLLPRLQPKGPASEWEKSIKKVNL